MRNCSGERRSGSASAANNVTALMHVDVLDFILPPLYAGGEHEGLFSRTTCEGTGGRVRLSGINLHLKRLVSRQIIAVKV
jgi:hypothetical protein